MSDSKQEKPKQENQEKPKQENQEKPKQETIDELLQRLESKYVETTKTLIDLKNQVITAQDAVIKASDELNNVKHQYLINVINSQNAKLKASTSTSTPLESINEESRTDNITDE